MKKIDCRLLIRLLIIIAICGLSMGVVSYFKSMLLIGYSGLNTTYYSMRFQGLVDNGAMLAYLIILIKTGFIIKGEVK